MKNLILILLCVCLKMITVQAQGTGIYLITVYDNNDRPLNNTLVSLIETTTKEEISKLTNEQGEVTFTLVSGKEWSVNILKMKNCRTIEVPENGKAKGSIFITYDYKHYERTHRPSVDRSKLNLSLIDQISLRNPQFTKTEVVIRIHLLMKNKNPLSSYPVNLTCYKISKTFLGKTDNNGYAYFLVPANNDYEVDIDGIESFSYVDVGQPGVYSQDCVYQPTNINETELNDTITQFIPKDSKGTSSRVYVKMRVSNYGENKLGNEDVYLQMLKTNKVYKAKTNSEGEAYFMLPVKRKYMVHFRYEKDVDVLNYSDVQGISNMHASFIYTPNPKLQFPERYIPTPQDLMVREFLEFITKQFPEPKNDDAMGLTLSWGNDNVNSQSKEAILQVGFKAKDAKGAIYGPPINISLVVDKSGSMEGHNRIDALKSALIKYINKLRKTDIVSLITFDDKSTVVVPAQAIGDGKFIKEKIEKIQAGGGTNIYNGMVDGYEQVLKNFLQKGTNRVILLTDGYGITPPEIMVNKSKEYNAKGIELSAVGVGDGYNQAMLALLATAGGGLLNFAGQAKDIDAVFERELSSVLSPCAKNVTVKIIYNDKIIFKQLYGFPFEKQGNEQVKMKLDNIYSGLNTLALVKFDLTQPNSTIEQSPVIVQMNYYDFKKKKEVAIEKKAYLKWSVATGQFELILEAEHKKLYAIAILNQSLKVMAETFSKNDYQSAYSVIQSTIEQVKKLYPQSTDEDVKKLVSEIENYALALTRVMANKEKK